MTLIASSNDDGAVRFECSWLNGTPDYPSDRPHIINGNGVAGAISRTRTAIASQFSKRLLSIRSKIEILTITIPHP